MNSFWLALVKKWKVKITLCTEALHGFLAVRKQDSALKKYLA